MLVSPPITTLDAKSKTITLVFSNPTDETIESTITVQHRAPRMPGGVRTMVRQKRPTGGAGLLAEEETPAPGTSRDSIDTSSPLVGWVKNLPSSLKLAPGEKKSISVTLDIPVDVKPGEYAAWIVTSTPAFDDRKPAKSATAPPKIDNGKENSVTIIHMVNADGSPTIIQAGAKLVLRVETIR